MAASKRSVSKKVSKRVRLRSSTASEQSALLLIKVTSGLIIYKSAVRLIEKIDTTIKIRKKITEKRKRSKEEGGKGRNWQKKNSRDSWLAINISFGIQ